MRTLLASSLLMLSVSSFAHEPYVAPLVYNTSQTQVAVVSGYAEEALNSEYALKDAKFEIISPNNNKNLIEPESKLGSTTVFDLKLPESGTYTVKTSTTYPLKYVQDQKEWKMFFDMPADQAPKKAERDYVIPADLKAKKYTPTEVKREWTLFTYVSKEKNTPIQAMLAPIQVEFLTHPNELKANQAVKIKVSKDNQALANANVVIRAKGATDEQAKNLKTLIDGTAELIFPKATEYLVEVSETVDSKKKPSNQFYTIISLSVN